MHHLMRRQRACAPHKVYCYEATSNANWNLMLFKASADPIVFAPDLSWVLQIGRGKFRWQKLAGQKVEKKIKEQLRFVYEAFSSKLDLWARQRHIGKVSRLSLSNPTTSSLLLLQASREPSFLYQVMNFFLLVKGFGRKKKLSTEEIIRFPVKAMWGEGGREESLNLHFITMMEFCGFSARKCQ